MQENQTSNVGSVKEKRRRIHFSPEKDIVLLKLVLQLNPFALGAHVWEKISQALKKKSFMVAARAVKDRGNHLMYVYKQQQLASINKSGSDELFEKREQLISEVIKLKANQHQAHVNNLGYSTDEKQNEQSQQSDSSDESCSPQMSPEIQLSEGVPMSNSLHEKLVSEKEWNNIIRTADELINSYSHRNKNDEMMQIRMQMDLSIKKQELELKKKETEVEVLKQRILEEELQLKNKELEIKRRLTEAEISRKEKELNLEEKRLKLEETKLEQTNAFQQTLLDQQKTILHLLTKLTEK